MHARRAAEAICRQLFVEHISPNPGNLMLDGLIEKLSAVGVLPRSISIPLRTIQGYGNFASHDSSQQEVFTPGYIQPCLQSLSVVTDWYFAEHMSHAQQVRPGSSSGEPPNSAVIAVGEFAQRVGLSGAAVIRLAREVLFCELRTPAALLSESQVKALEDEIRATRARRCSTEATPVRSFDLGDGVALDFVLVPAGSFTMGSPINEEGHNDDELQHSVTISRSLYMGRFPVTQEQHQTVLGSNPSYFPGATNPVEMVSWFDAISFCELLAERFGKAFRLPSEAEWEYACRGETVTAFNTGDRLSTDQANFDGRLGPGSAQAGLSRRSTTPVDMFASNTWGLHDMHGNVWEWCNDWYDAYPNALVVDPRGPAEGSIRILRGGSWFHGAADARSAQRDALDPGRRHGIYGFRVAFNE
jgi:formylglycine-generating enzyme required for sulfatase activity